MQEKKYRIPKEFLGAFKAGHRQSARDFIDEEFSYELLRKVVEDGDQEAKKQLAYITKFNNEFHKNVIKKGDPNALHNTDKLRKDCYDRENARNRDITSREGKRFSTIDDIISAEASSGDKLTLNEAMNSGRNLANHEDVMIELMDWQSKKKNS